MIVTDLLMFPDEKGFRICWSGDVGFGEFNFHKNDNDEWEIDTECMGDETIKEALTALVDFIPNRS